MDNREVVAVQTYLIRLRDRQLALTVGAELEDRLARDGHKAVALVPTGNGLGLAGADGGRAGGRGSYRAAPLVVALYEEGLLARLESLGLTAYVGVCPEEEPGVVHWPHGGAILLPVGTARDLIDAVATHTPWASHAERMARFAVPSGPYRGLAETASSALPRKLAMAGIAGPLLLAGVPAAAAAAPAHAGHHPSARAGVTATDATLLAARTRHPVKRTARPPIIDNGPAPQRLPANLRALLIQIENALRALQARQVTAGNTPANQALENQIARLVNTLLNSRQAPAQQAQPTQPAQQAAAPQGGAPTNAGTQTPGGAQQSRGSQGQGQGQPVGQGQDGQQGAGQDGQGQDGQQGSGSQGSTTSQGSQSGQGSTSSGMGTSSSGSASPSGWGSSGRGTSSGGASSGGASSGGYSGGGSSGGTSSGGGSA